MAITAGIAVGSAIVGGVMGNQQAQKAKGQAGQAERDAQAAQAAADAKLAEQHREDIQAQSQAGAVARKAMGGTINPNTPIAPPLAAPTAPPSITPAVGQHKTLLGS